MFYGYTSADFKTMYFVCNTKTNIHSNHFLLSGTLWEQILIKQIILTDMLHTLIIFHLMVNCFPCNSMISLSLCGVLHALFALDLCASHGRTVYLNFSTSPGAFEWGIIFIRNAPLCPGAKIRFISLSGTFSRNIRLCYQFDLIL